MYRLKFIIGLICVEVNDDISTQNYSAGKPGLGLYHKASSWVRSSPILVCDC